MDSVKRDRIDAYFPVGIIRSGSKKNNAGWLNDLVSIFCPNGTLKITMRMLPCDVYELEMEITTGKESEKVTFSGPADIGMIYDSGTLLMFRGLGSRMVFDILDDLGTISVPCIVVSFYKTASTVTRQG